MNKEIEYRGHKFNIKVELKTGFEKNIDNVGVVNNTVTINNIGGSNYYKIYKTPDNLLVGTLKLAEKEAEMFIDKKYDELDGDPTVVLLKELGFK